MHLRHSHGSRSPVLPGWTQSSLDELETEILRNKVCKVFTGSQHHYITAISKGGSTLSFAVLLKAYLEYFHLLYKENGGAMKE